MAEELNKEIDSYTPFFLLLSCLCTGLFLAGAARNAIAAGEAPGKFKKPDVAVEFFDRNGNGGFDEEAKIDTVDIEEKVTFVIPLEKKAVISGPFVWSVVLLCVVVLFVRSKKSNTPKCDS